jgi:F-type H+-transporting ATPase subunit gamma
METMRDIRTRVRSVRQSLQVTQAMKLIATAKLRKSRRNLEETRPYFDGIRHALREVVEGAGLEAGPWFDRREDKPERKVATLAVTSDRGLAGGFNSAVVRHVEAECPPGSILLPVGAVGKRQFMARNYVLLGDSPSMGREPTTFLARDLAGFVSSLFLAGTIDVFRVVYTRLQSAVRQEVVVEELLPLDACRIARGPASRVAAYGGAAGGGLPYEAFPDEDELLSFLVPKYLKGVIFGALVESFASEQAARMQAMDASTRNAREMLDRLQLLYNRARQAAITAEVSEIVAGAAALSGGSGP